MQTNLSGKQSSRSGRFKKKLVSEDTLEKEAVLIQERMTPFITSYQQQKLSPAEFAAIYILTVLSYRYPTTWLGSKAPVVESEHKILAPIELLKQHWEPNIQKRLDVYSSIGEIFQNFALKSTPLKVNRSILNWSIGNYGLELMFRIPTSAEVLEQQKRGRRCVTVILEASIANKLILGERDALGFCMHDFIHADHFYHNNECYQGQLGFYGFLDYCLKQKHFDELFGNAEFAWEFDYFISDMNAYAIHLLKCFKSALIHYHPKKDDFFKEWINKLNLTSNEQKAFLDLNTAAYSDSSDHIFLNLLQSYKA